MRFAAGETLSEALLRVTAEQFDIALRIATAPRDELPGAVHGTRKAIKRLRSVLRLVRGSVSRDSYSADNEMLKLIAAELGTIRDAWVMSQILHRLLPNSDPAGTANTLIDRLQHRYHTESAALTSNEAQMVSIVGQLEHARELSQRWAVADDPPGALLTHSFSVIADGIGRVYKRGRRGMRIVSESPTDTLLHVWRKRVKYLRHQIEALNVVDPEMMSALESDLETLSDLLGDDHDLAVLSQRIRRDQTLTRDLEMGPVLDAIASTRRDLQRDSMELGRLLYEDSTTAFLARLATAWGDGETF